MFTTGATSTSSIMYVVQLKASGKTFFPHSASCSETVGLPCMIRIEIMEVGAFAFEGLFELKGFDESRAGTCLI